MGWKFWAGVTLMIVGMAVMALPNDKPCVDCDDEVTTDTTPIYSEDSVTPEATDG